MMCIPKARKVLKMGSYPNLLIIGAMKSGTTSLHDYLSQHPEIFMSSPKELHYYKDKSKISKQQYLNLFRSVKKIRGTSPQSYTKAHYPEFENIPEKIYKDTPEVKLIYIVRDPFERILSHALENRYGDKLSRINQNQESGHYWKTSMYYYQISEYLKYFQRSQIHVLTLEDLKRNKLKELNSIFRFLGVREMKDQITFDYIKNAAESKKLPYFIKSKLWYRIIHRINKAKAEKIASEIVKKDYSNFLKKPSLKELIDDKVVESIQEDARMLEETFAVNISQWNLQPNLNN